MVLKALIEWFAGVTHWFYSLLPLVPDEIADAIGAAADAIGGFLDQAAVLGPVIPWDVVAGCWGAILGATALGLVIELVRMALSYITLGGGSL